jgi:hypothetical protein
MIRPRPFYPKSSECLLLLFDLRDPVACEQVHRLRTIWQENSDLEALGPDHMIVFLYPGGAARRLAT